MAGESKLFTMTSVLKSILSSKVELCDRPCSTKEISFVLSIEPLGYLEIKAIEDVITYTSSISKEIYDQRLKDLDGSSSNRHFVRYFLKDISSPIQLYVETSAFRKKVYEALSKVPYGYTLSYQELAQLAGYPKAVRAVATTMAKNTIPLLLGCHRVIRSDRSLGGYRFGQELKQKLIEFEKRSS